MGDRPSRGVSRRAVLRLATGVAAGLVVGEAAYGVLYERHHLGVTRADVACHALPPALAGLRIGLITDTHYSSFTSLAFIEQAVPLLQRRGARSGGARRRLCDPPQSPLHRRVGDTVCATERPSRRVRRARQSRRRCRSAEGAATGGSDGDQRRPAAAVRARRDRRPARPRLLDAAPRGHHATRARSRAVHGPAGP